MRCSAGQCFPWLVPQTLIQDWCRCEELELQPRGTRGESGGQTGITYDISNKHRLGYSEVGLLIKVGMCYTLLAQVELVQKMIDGVNTLWREDKELVAKQG